MALVKDGKELVAFEAMSPTESRSLTPVPEVDGAILKLGRSGRTADQAWTIDAEWTDPSGTPYSLKFQKGNLYAIVVDPVGQAAVYSVPETFSSDPKLCIVNAAPTTLSQVQAAPDWAKNVKVYSQDVVPVVPSEFYSLEPKTLGLYWQTLDQVAKGDHVTAKGFDGKPLRQTFVQGRYYLFLAGDGSVRDLTPTLD